MSVHEDQLSGGGVYKGDVFDRSHEGCYLYVPRTAEEKTEQRPSKRRKITQAATYSETPREYFPTLLSGHENVKYARCRELAFHKCWADITSRIAHLLEPVDDDFLHEIVEFVKHAPTLIDQERLRTGLISSGPRAGSQRGLLERWKATQSHNKTAIVVSIDATQAGNLITALKNLIRAAIAQLEGADGYQRFLNERKRSIYMNYDLQLLQEFVTLKGVRKCVVYLTDIEAFDMALLTDLIALVSGWRDRIPFVLLLGISTTVELFEARLPKSTIRLLDCRILEPSTGIDPCLEIYRSLHSQSSPLAISLGPVISSVLFEMSREQDASALSFSRAIKYAVVSHFFANALSVLLTPDDGNIKANRELCDAIRATDSFREYAEGRLGEGDAKAVRDLLNDDEALLVAAREGVQNGQDAISRHHLAVETFETVLNVVNLTVEAPPDSFSIQVQALSGPSFLNSALYTDLISRITSLSSDRMRKMLDAIHQNDSSPDLAIDSLLQKLNRLAPANTKPPLRSSYDPSHTTTSTTITNNKVTLSKHGPKLSPTETEYTHLVDQIIATLASHFETNIRNPNTLFMHEAFLYDLKSPLATVFAPRPRYATERALASPYDYLGCDCCDGRALGQVSASQPPTSVLWQLWCEAGGIVNVRDLWNAFSAVVAVERGNEEEEEQEQEQEREVEGQGNRDGSGDGDGDGDREVEADQVNGVVDDRVALALFYRGLAELRMMGFVKGTKRKVDCLAKTAWKGM